MFKLPVEKSLERSRTVLIAGAGGGFDVFVGLPLYFGLQAAGKQVVLANWTFSELDSHNPTIKSIDEHLYLVDADSEGEYYFPEKYLSRWFKSRGAKVPIYCFTPCGTQQLLNSYSTIVKNHQIDTVLLVDGGTDSLLRGDEDDLGTPHEDMTSIAAVDLLQCEQKILASIGFGIDTYHGVCHSHVLESIARQIRNRGYLGAISLTNDMPEVDLFKKASKSVFHHMPEAISIVVSSLISAIEGEFGDYHVTERTQGSQLYINPLMPIYWFFDVKTIAESITYIDDLKRAKTFAEVMQAIRRRTTAGKPWRQIPL